MFLYFHILDEKSDQEEVSPDSLRVDSLWFTQPGWKMCFLHTISFNFIYAYTLVLTTMFLSLFCTFKIFYNIICPAIKNQNTRIHPRLKKLSLNCTKYGLLTMCSVQFTRKMVLKKLLFTIDKELYKNRRILFFFKGSTWRLRSTAIEPFRRWTDCSDFIHHK